MPGRAVRVRGIARLGGWGGACSAYYRGEKVVDELRLRRVFERF